MPQYPGTIINGKWYASSPYGPTNASGGVNVAPYGPWNGMPASGMSPVIGTPTNFNVGGPSAGSTFPTLPTSPNAGGSTVPNSAGSFWDSLGLGGNLAGQIDYSKNNPAPTGYSTSYRTGTPTLVQDPTGPVNQSISGQDTRSASGISPTLSLVGGNPNAAATGSFGSGPYSPGASPNLESISNLVNQINLAAQQQANAGRVPGGQAVENQLMQNTAQLAQGQLPADVIAQIQQQAAERGIQTGNSDYLKALGLNSLQAQQTAQGNLSAAYARNPAAPIFDPTTQLLTPGQAGALNNQLGIENAKLALEWYYALHPELRGGGGGGGGRTAPSPTDPTSALPSWFPTVGGTPSPVAPTGGGTIPISGGGVGTGLGYDIPTNNPYGTGYYGPGSPGDLFGGLSGVGYGQQPYTGYSAPSSGMGDPFGGYSGIGYDTGLGGEDPFYLYGG